MTGLKSLGAESIGGGAPKRLIIMFSPNGTLPDQFWPDQFGDEDPVQIKPMLQALEPFREQLLILKGVHNKIEGDGDRHMRGMSCC